VWTACIGLCYQELCREWDARPDTEKQFEPFYKAVSAVAFSSGIKLKTHAFVLNTVTYSHHVA